MSLSRRLLALAYPPLATVHAIRRQARLRVLLCHDVPPHRIDEFAARLEWLMRRWTFVSPGQFAELLSGETPIERDTLLLTFDDGFASNRTVADRVLARLGISALFFIVNTFVELERREDQVRFIRDNLELGLADTPAHMRGMTLADLRHLLGTGHSIGAHTGTHMRLSSAKSDAQLADEMVAAADELEQKIGAGIDHFAFPFGNLQSFGPAALDVARRRFRYVHTGLRGDNATDTPAWAIRRDAVDLDDSKMLMGAFLEGAADRRYARDLAEYESWGR